VLANLERAAADVNERVRRVETEARLWAELGNNEWRSKLDSTALVLVADYPMEIVKSGGRRSLSFGTSRLRSLSFSKKRGTDDSEGSSPPGKLYLFADCLLLAKASKDKGKFKLKAAWMLTAVSVELQPDKGADAEGGVEKSTSSFSSKRTYSLNASRRSCNGSSSDEPGSEPSPAPPPAGSSSGSAGADAPDAAGPAELLVLKHTESNREQSFVLRLEAQPGMSSSGAAHSLRECVTRLKEAAATRKLSAMGANAC